MYVYMYYVCVCVSVWLTVCLSVFLSIYLSNYYTDGSRDGNSVACATVFPSHTELSMRLPDSASIFTAEIWAIITALEEIKNASESKFIIFTDSRSCLQALLYMKLEHPLIGMAIRNCVFLNIANKDIILCWVPSHVGIRGNEKADSAAKSALDLPHAQVGVPYTDFKLLISQYIFSHLARWLEWCGRE